MAVEAVKKILKKYEKEIEKSPDVIITDREYYDSDTGARRRAISIDFQVGSYQEKGKKEESHKEYIR
jgi:hypothetical protein